jgi:hypothetical protein
MAEVQIKGCVEQGLVVLDITYGQELLFRPETSKRLGEALIAEYQEQRRTAQPPATSCVVVIHSLVAGSPLLRALFELWKIVADENRGKVVCVDYPVDFIDALTALGLNQLGGFSLAGTKAEAFREAAPRETP